MPGRPVTKLVLYLYTLDVFKTEYGKLHETIITLKFGKKAPGE